MPKNPSDENMDKSNTNGKPQLPIKTYSNKSKKPSNNNVKNGGSVTNENKSSFDELKTKVDAKSKGIQKPIGFYDNEDEDDQIDDYLNPPKLFSLDPEDQYPLDIDETSTSNGNKSGKRELNNKENGGRHNNTTPTSSKNRNNNSECGNNGKRKNQRPTNNENNNSENECRAKQIHQIATNSKNTTKNKNSVPFTSSSNSNSSSSSGKAYGGNSSYLSKEPLNNIPTLSPNPSTSLSIWNNNNTSPNAPSTSNYTAKVGVVGLNNLGNSCYLNSGLQALFHTYPLIQFFLHNSLVDGVGVNGIALTVQFQNLMRLVWSGTHSTINPTDFKTVVGQSNPHFKDNRQHDCQELISTVLDKLNEQLLKWKESSQKRAISPNNPDIEFVQETKKLRLDDKNPQKRTGATTPDQTTQSKKKKPNQNENENKMETDENDGPSSSKDTPKNSSVVQNLTSLEEKRKTIDDFWNNYYMKNETVITSSFHGLYKSTVVCSTCGYVSVTHEPFIYLSVPFPRIFERDIDVFYVNMTSPDFPVPNKININVSLTHQISTIVDKVYTKLVTEIDGPLVQHDKNYFVVCEVHNYAISKIVNPKDLVKYLKYKNRNIYIYEINDVFGKRISPDEPFNYEKNYTNNESCFPTMSSNFVQPTFQEGEENWEDDPTLPVSTCENQPQVSSTSDDVTKIHDLFNVGEESCKICLELKPYSELREHNNCNCKLCQDCIESCIIHFDVSSSDPESINFESEPSQKPVENNTNHLKCPICMIVTTKNTFMPLFKSSNDSNYASKLILIPIVYRNTPVSNSDTNNNNNNLISELKVCGVPRLARIPSIITGADLYDYFNRFNMFTNPEYKLLIVSNDGKSCGKCGTYGCLGCEIEKTAVEIMLKPTNNTIAISYNDLDPGQMNVMLVNEMKENALFTSNYFNSGNDDEPSVHIQDCLKAFSQTEYLDAPEWFCDQCNKKTCATKSIVVCKFPPHLIIVLKRFEYTDVAHKINNKLIYPMTDLDLREHIAEESADVENLKYNLYSVVCHIGSANGGHYIAYGKNPLTNVWHYFSDTLVQESEPSESECRTAYVLFYERQGMTVDMENLLKNANLSQQVVHQQHQQNNNSNSTPFRPIGVVPPSTSTSSSSSNIATSYRNYQYDNQLASSTCTDDPYAFEPEIALPLPPLKSLYSTTNNGLSLNESTELTIGPGSSAQVSSTSHFDNEQQNGEDLNIRLMDQAQEQIDEGFFESSLAGVYIPAPASVVTTFYDNEPPPPSNLNLSDEEMEDQENKIPPLSPIIRQSGGGNSMFNNKTGNK